MTTVSAEAQGASGERILLVRIHDGRLKSNWGGRSTSLALLDIFSEGRDPDNVQVISGNYLLRGFGAPVEDAEILGAKGWVSKLPPPLPEKPDSLSFHKPLGAVAKQLLVRHRHRPVVSWIRSMIRDADHVVINGEGDFILKKRPTLWRCLAIAWMAKHAGKKLSIINTVLSASEDGIIDPDVTYEIGNIFKIADHIAFRDPKSLALARKLYPRTPMAYIPDALYAWRGAMPSRADALTGPGAEGIVWETRAALSKPFVAISGSSVKMDADDIAKAKTKLTALVRVMLSRGLGVLVLPTCDGDRWMMEPARAAGAVTVLPTIPLDVGCRLLAKAELFISGRWHPSILASMVGTPSVLMRSNCHKTQSIQKMLGANTVVEHPWFSDDASLTPLIRHVDRVLATREQLSRELLATSDRLRADALKIRSYIGI